MGRRIAIAAAFVVLVLAAVVIVRTLALEPHTGGGEPAKRRAVDIDGAATRLAQGLRFETISYGSDRDVPADAFLALHAHLERSYPRVHLRLEREVVSAYSLLYRWPGRDPDLEPVLLMAHQDVVPVDAALWQHAPFGGEIVDGVLWGRGVIDDKGAMYAILEAAELLLSEGFEPAGDVYLFFGHDEELGGTNGAAVAAAELEARGVTLDWVLDEGGFVVQGMLPGADSPIALVGVAEKGSATFTLTVDGPGGHSSIPPRHGNIGILAQAITRLESSPMPGDIGGLPARSLRAVAPELPFGIRMILANLWLFGPVVEAAMTQSAPLDAMLRTTTAVTVVHAGVKSNVLPSHAQATVNFRIKPGESADTIEAHVRRIVGDDRVEIARRGDGRPPSPVSPTDGPAFERIARSIQATFAGAPVVPYLVVGGTDARHFHRITPNVYRFNPFRYGPDDAELIHGTDERMAVEQLGPAVDFYARLIEGSGSPGSSGSSAD